MPSLVSIIIPCFNAGPWLAQALGSALQQSWPDCEVIVVDDGSTDASLAIARSMADPRLRVLTQANAGAGAARNAGLRAARGDYLQFLDADDLLAPDKIERQMRVLATAAPGSLASGAWGTFSGDPAATSFQPEPVWANAAPVDWLVRSWSGGGMMQPAAWLTPRSLCAAAGPWDERISLDDDGEYFTRIILASAGIVFVESARVYYRRHDGSRLSASRGRRAAESSWRSCDSKERHLLAIETSPRTRRAVACNWQRLACEQLLDAPDLAATAVQRARTLDPGLPPPAGTRAFRLVSRILGWPTARRWQLRALRLLNR